MHIFLGGRNSFLQVCKSLVRRSKVVLLACRSLEPAENVFSGMKIVSGDRNIVWRGMGACMPVASPEKGGEKNG